MPSFPPAKHTLCAHSSSAAWGSADPKAPSAAAKKDLSSQGAQWRLTPQRRPAPLYVFLLCEKPFP